MVCQLSWWMPVVSSGVVGARWGLVGLGAGVLRVSSSDAALEAALSDTSRMKVADRPAIWLSAWGQTA